MPDGFFFEELSNFQKNIMEKIYKKYPEDTCKFLKTQAKELSKIQKKIAKQDVKTTGKNGEKSYHKKFKTGKIYDFEGSQSIRAFNSAPHGHLIENGHKTQNGKFVPGKYVMKISQNKFKGTFYKNAENFIADFIEELTY